MTLPRRDFLRDLALAGAVGATAQSASGFWDDATAAPSGKRVDSRFLLGNFGPVHEERTVESLEIVGKLPDGLNGMFVRNGPNPQFPPKGKYHWFDGDGMLHGVRISDGRASYRNRYVQTIGYKAEKGAGKAIWGGLLDPPDFSRVAEGIPPFKNAANTALVWHHGKLLALWEGGEPHEVAVPSLATVGPDHFGGKLRHNFTAHPKVDPRTGEMMFFGYGFMRPYVHYSVADKSGKIVRTLPIDLPNPVMMHDFAVTERHSIFMDLPETMRMDGKAKGALRLSYRPDLGARFGIIPRHGQPSDLKWFTAKPCYVFHTLGAYEDGDDVTLLACRIDQFPEEIETGQAPSSLAPGQLENMPGGSVLYRWKFNLKTGLTSEGPLDDVGCEFPRQREDLLGQRPRYGYAMKLDMTGLIKYDLEKGTSQTHSHGPGRFGGEGVFIPRPGAQGEDDGWILSYVHDSSADRGELVVLAANDFTSPPLARALIPARIPYGFHATWIPGEEIARPA